MANIQHSALTGADLHEPKGAAAASADEVYIADGAASGAWAQMSAAKVSIADTGSYFTGTDVEAALQELGPKISYLTLELTDISTASFVLIPIPVDCVVNEVQTILHGAITAADAVITVTRGGDAATLGTITVANSGSAEGDQDENTSLSNNTVTRATNKYIKVATDGGSTNTVALSIQIKITA